jgi:hypothetical protein
MFYNEGIKLMLLNNHSHAVLILCPEVKVLSVTFNKYTGGQSQEYNYKYVNLDINVGDTVIVPTHLGSTLEYKLATVSKVDVGFDISSNRTLNWVVDKIDFEKYNANLVKEKEIIGKLNDLKQRQATEEIRQAIVSHLALSGADTQALTLSFSNKD